MPDFPIKIGTEFDNTGVHAAAKGLEEVGEKGQESGNKMHEGAEKAIGSHRELHEGIDLLGQASGGALGKFAELARFMANPYFLAIAGAMQAIEMLTKQHEQLVEQQEKNIEASEQMHKAFKDGIAEGARQAAEKINDLISAHERNAEATDTETQALERQEKINQIINQSVQQQISDNESLYKAKIKLREAQGEITPEQANAENRNADRGAEAQKFFEQEQAAKADAQAKRERAQSAAGESTEAIGKLNALKPDLTDIDASVITQENRVKTLQADAEEKRKAATKTRAEADNASVFMPGYNEKKNAAPKAEAAAQAAEDLAAGQVQHLAELKEQQKEMNRQADSLAKLADERDAVARKLKEEADSIDADIKAKRQGFDQHLATERQTDDAENRTDQVNRRNRDVQHGTATAQEQQEYKDQQTRNAARSETGPQATIDAREVIGNAQALVARAQGQAHPDSQTLAQVHGYLQKAVGLSENQSALSTSMIQQMEQIAHKLSEVERQTGYNTQRLAVSGSVF